MPLIDTVVKSAIKSTVQRVDGVVDSGGSATSYTISNIIITGDGDVTANSPSTPATVTTEAVTLNVTVNSGREIDYIRVEGLGDDAPLTMTGAGTTWTRAVELSGIEFIAVSRPGQGTYDIVLTVTEGTTGTAVIKIEGAED